VKKILGKLRGLTRRDDGASAVEYGLLIALIAVVIAGTVAILGTTLKGKLDESCKAVAGTSASDTACSTGGSTSTGG